MFYWEISCIGHIGKCVQERINTLLLLDQDVFNLLYGAYTLQVNNIWDFDARYYSLYQLKIGGKCNIDWVMQNTVFLYFCEKQKLWKSKSFNRFSTLYKHYMNFLLIG